METVELFFFLVVYIFVIRSIDIYAMTGEKKWWVVVVVIKHQKSAMKKKITTLSHFVLLDGKSGSRST